jgi:thioesterase domain-containing protein
MRADSSFGRDYLQNRIAGEFPLAQHIGIVVESVGASGVVLRAPLAPNANFKGTAFGGSQFCIAVLAGWVWTTRYLAVHQIAADAVVQESTIRYLVPVQGALRATLTTPNAEQIEKFRKMLLRAGRGRIRLHVDIHYGHRVATEFDGMFAAAVR